MNKKILSLFVGLSLFLLFSSGFVLANDSLTVTNLTMVSPAASGTISGAEYNVNVSITQRDVDYLAENWTWARVWLVSTSKSANTTAKLVSDWDENTTAHEFNISIDTTDVEDANDYTLVLQMRNNSVGATNVVYMNVSRSGITVDNTDPDAPTITPTSYTQITAAETRTFTGAVTNSKTTSCTYQAYRTGSALDSKSSSGSGTYSGSSCTFDKTFTDFTDNGEYQIKITASDETDTASSTTIFSVQIPGNSGAGTTPIQRSNSTIVILGAVIVLIGSVAVMILTTPKKKGRRR